MLDFSFFLKSEDTNSQEILKTKAVTDAQDVNIILRDINDLVIENLENVWNTVFPKANEKRGKIFRCVLL